MELYFSKKRLQLLLGFFAVQTLKSCWPFHPQTKDGKFLTEHAEN